MTDQLKAAKVLPYEASKILNRHKITPFPTDDWTAYVATDNQTGKVISSMASSRFENAFVGMVDIKKKMKNPETATFIICAYQNGTWHQMDDKDVKTKWAKLSKDAKKVLRKNHKEQNRIVKHLHPAYRQAMGE